MFNKGYKFTRFIIDSSLITLLALLLILPVVSMGFVSIKPINNKPNVAGTSDSRDMTKEINDTNEMYYSKETLESIREFEKKLIESSQSSNVNIPD